jgi:hypothetical protein
MCYQSETMVVVTVTKRRKVVDIGGHWRENTSLRGYYVVWGAVTKVV